jgi:DNA-binding NarL/FixJ family response regulator
MPTVVSAKFEDLVAVGLAVLIRDDPNLELVAAGVPVDEIEAAVETHAPDVVLLNFGTLRAPAQVFQLHQAYPDTRIVVLANRPTAAECNQMLSFGATACLSKETEARDVVNAIHLAHQLSIGIETVRTHARNIYRKLGIGSRRELVRMNRGDSIVGSDGKDLGTRHRDQRHRGEHGAAGEGAEEAGLGGEAGRAPTQGAD